MDYKDDCLIKGTNFIWEKFNGKWKGKTDLEVSIQTAECAVLIACVDANLSQNDLSDKKNQKSCQEHEPAGGLNQTCLHARNLRGRSGVSFTDLESLLTLQTI